MKKKWWIITTACLVVCVGLGFAIPAMLPPRSGVSKENFDRLEVGMTHAQVETIMGKPPANTIDGTVIWENENTHEAIVVRFDEKESLAVKRFFGDDRTAIKKLLDRLPWLTPPQFLPPGDTHEIIPD